MMPTERPAEEMGTQQQVDEASQPKREAGQRSTVLFLLVSNQRP